MVYDSYNYEIKRRLPEWWKEDSFLEPINRYSQKLIKDLIGGLLENFGVIQPFQVWKTLPTEYNWTHVYQSHDSLLRKPEGGTTSLNLLPNDPIRAYLPNSKRNCHAVIQLQLEGNEDGLSQKLDKLTIRNGNQKIIFSNITTSSEIKIFTETNNILIDGTNKNNLVTGSFNKIHSQAKNTNFDEVSIYDENKTTYLEIESSQYVNFSLKIKLIHPVYVTEQNIRIHSVSAFPIEWIKLYGFFCHDFNNKQEWRFLWEKNYKEEDRVVYDRITKQFDCETFYIQVKLYGIGIPFVYGFPQEKLSTNAAFQTNNRLDKWGKIYSLPRRYYKTKISDDEEPYTFPPYYKYNIEQDYWYEQRIVNEYRFDERAVNATFIKDSNLNNIAVLSCIDPFMHDLYVYTETIKKDTDRSKQTDEILPEFLNEKGEGVTWKTPHEVTNTQTTATETVLQPKKSEFFNSKEYQTKELQIKFDIPPLPKNIEIKGIELLLYGHADLHSNKLALDDRSQLLLPILQEQNDVISIKKIDNIPINTDIKYWEKGKNVYKIGGPTDLFNIPNGVTKEQLEQGLAFNIGFTNNHDFLKATIILYSIKLIIYYEMIESSYDVEVELDKREIVLNDPNKQSINLKVHLKNTGTLPVVNKNIYVASSNEVDITNKTSSPFDLNVGEEFTIGELNQDKIVITPKKYNHLKLKVNDSIEQSVSQNSEKFTFYYKTNNKGKISIYKNNELIDTIDVYNSRWKKYEYKTYNIVNNENEENQTQQNDSFKIKVLEGEILLKNSSKWTSNTSAETVNEVKTGIYDIVVFCDDKIIKNEIVIKEGLEEV